MRVVPALPARPGPKNIAPSPLHAYFGLINGSYRPMDQSVVTEVDFLNARNSDFTKTTGSLGRAYEQLSATTDTKLWLMGDAPQTCVFSTLT